MVAQPGTAWIVRAQLKDGNSFLRCLVPTLLGIMMIPPNTLWGAANYPVVKIS